MRKKIYVVIAEGEITSIFSEDEIDVEVIDFDKSWYDEEEQNYKADRVDQLRKTMKETLI